MTDKPEFVDMIGEATRQNRRRAMPVIIEPEVKETSRLAHRRRGWSNGGSRT